MKIIFLIAVSYFTFTGSWLGCLVVVTGIALYFSPIKFRRWGVAAVVFLAVSTVMVEAYISYSKKMEASARGEIPSKKAQDLVTLGWEDMIASPPDYLLALYHNLEGYKLNHPEAAANIGLLYENGWGVEKDEATAASWYQKAIAMGSFRSAQADYQLARLYEKGLGVERDLDRAISHYSEALRISTHSVFNIYQDDSIAELSSAALDRLHGNISVNK